MISLVAKKPVLNYVLCNMKSKLQIDFEFCIDVIKEIDKDSYLESFNEREIYENTLRIPFPLSALSAQDFTAIPLTGLFATLQINLSGALDSWTSPRILIKLRSDTGLQRSIGTKGSCLEL